MGTAATEREATADELLAMQELLRLGLEAGGLGFHHRGQEHIMIHLAMWYPAGMQIEVNSSLSAKCFLILMGHQ